ncbi:MAG: NAD(P)-dependent malic enzyme [Oscillospiraceae bacterium]
MNIYDKALEKHKHWQGKIETTLKMDLDNKDDLSIAYTPGVAQPCIEIHKDVNKVYDYTMKNNLVAVITDGSAVLGLGNIGPHAALPVMEGKSALFKKFANIDSIPICLDTQDTEEIISIVKAISPTFGGINLEDISSPRCVEIETRLKEELDIPVFHDDQHGTAIVTTAALINALKVVNKKKEDITVVISGVGAAGSSIINMLNDFGVNDIIAFNRKGVISNDTIILNNIEKNIQQVSNKTNFTGSFEDAFKLADVFIGVSSPNIVTKKMIENMKSKPIVFAMANPEPEISYEDAKEAGAFVIGTGRSDYPNQINNVLAFPGLFKGALSSKSKKITEEMKLGAAIAISTLISDEQLTKDYIIPSVFDERVVDVVSIKVKEIAIKLNICR